MKRLSLLLLVLVSFALLLGLGVSAQDSNQGSNQDSGEGPLPQGPHVNLVYAKCQSCHNLKYVTDSAGLPPFLWEDTLDLMVQLGMQVTDEEKDNLLEYLSTYLGPNPPPESAAASTGTSGGAEADASGSSAENASTQTAAGPDGKALYSSDCASCHRQNGQGVAGGFPPLIEYTPELYQAEGGRDYLANLMLYGLQGEITVDGASYNGVMPAWAHLDAADIAAILNYTLTIWGNEGLLPESFTPYAAADVADERGQGLSTQDMLGRRLALSSE